MTTITQDQYYQLIGLHAASTAQWRVIEAIEKAAYAITKEPGTCGHTTDFLFDGTYKVEDLLERLQLTVEKP